MFSTKNDPAGSKENGENNKSKDGSIRQDNFQFEVEPEMETLHYSFKKCLKTLKLLI